MIPDEPTIAAPLACTPRPLVRPLRVFARWRPFLIVALFMPALVPYYREVFGGSSFPDDVCQHIAPYRIPPSTAGARHGDPEQYLRACHPIGYRFLMTAASRVADPRPFARILAAACFALFLIGVYRCGRRLGRPVAAAASLALALSSPVFLNRIEGGFPRAFAIPCWLSPCPRAWKDITASWRSSRPQRWRFIRLWP